MSPGWRRFDNVVLLNQFTQVYSPRKSCILTYMNNQIVNIFQISVFIVIFLGSFMLYKSGTINNFLNKDSSTSENVSTQSENEIIEQIPVTQDDSLKTEPNTDIEVANKNSSADKPKATKTSSEDRMYFAPEFFAENIKSSMIQFSESQVEVEGEMNRVRIPVWFIKDQISLKQYLKIQLVPPKTLKSINYEDTEITRTSNDFILFERRFISNGKLLSSSVYAEKIISSDAKLTFEVSYGTGAQYQFTDQTTALGFLKKFIETIDYNVSLLSEITIFFHKLSNMGESESIQAINDANESVNRFIALRVLSEPYGISKLARDFMRVNSQMSGFCASQKEYFEGKGFKSLDYICIDGKTSAAFYTEIDLNLFQCFDALESEGNKIVTSDKVSNSSCTVN